MRGLVLPTDAISRFRPFARPFTAAGQVWPKTTMIDGCVQTRRVPFFIHRSQQKLAHGPKYRPPIRERLDERGRVWEVESFLRKLISLVVVSQTKIRFRFLISFKSDRAENKYNIKYRLQGAGAWVHARAKLFFIRQSDRVY